MTLLPATMAATGPHHVAVRFAGGGAGLPLLLAGFGLSLAHVFEKTTASGRTSDRWDGLWFAAVLWAGVFAAMAALLLA